MNLTSAVAARMSSGGVQQQSHGVGHPSSGGQAAIDRSSRLKMARPSTNGFLLPAMWPTTTTASPSLAALRASRTLLAPAGSDASRYFAPSTSAPRPGLG